MKCKIFNIRICKGNLTEDQKKLNEFLDSVDIKKLNMKCIEGNISYWSVCIFYEDLKKDIEISKIKMQDRPLIDIENDIFDNLVGWRGKQAEKENIPVFMVAHNKTLKYIAMSDIKTKNDLLNISGLGKSKVEKYGDVILEIVKVFRD